MREWVRSQPSHVAAGGKPGKTMIVIVSAALGALYGGLTARKRQGSKLDIAQYAGVYAVVFALVGLAVTVLIMRMAT